MAFGINTKRASALLTCGIAAAGIISGCGDKTPETSTTVINQTAPETSRPASAPVPGPSGAVVTNDTNAGAGGASGTQTALADEISKTITRNTQMTGSRVNVVVDDTGVATLTGFTQNQQQKALAEKAAKSIAGISLVSNKLEIRPTGGTGKASPPPAPQTQIIVVPGAPAPAAPAAPAPVPSVAGARDLPPGETPTSPATEGGTAPAVPPVPPTNP